MPSSNPIELTGPILDSTPLLGTDVWQEAIDHFDVFAEAEANAGLPLEQQQYLSDLRVDHLSLRHARARNSSCLTIGCRKTPGTRKRPESHRFCGAGPEFGARSWIDQQEKLYLWAQKNEREDLAASILGWRLLCQELAESLLAWSLQSITTRADNRSGSGRIRRDFTRRIA